MSNRVRPSLATPRFRTRGARASLLQAGLLSLTVALLALGCGGSGESTRKEPTQSLADTSFGFVGVEPIEEDGSKKRVGVAPNLVERMDEIRDALPMLQEARVSLAMIIQAVKIQDPSQLEEVFALEKAASARGLELRPIPVLSADDGYFPNATNVDSYVSVVRSLVAQWKARGLRPGMLIVDMEPPRDLMQALTSFRLGKAVPKDQIDRARYATAKTTYAALVDELHREGWKVGVTTQATILADYQDGDDDMRQYFNVVLDDVAWDQLDFQLYRSAYRAQAPNLDAYFVYDFVRRATQQFPGQKIGIGLGLTHPGPIYPDTKTEDSQALRADLEAAVAAGVRRELITIYNLKGILLGPPVCEKVLPCKADEYVYKPNDPRRWFIDARGAPAPAESRATGFLWQQFGLMDKVLNMSEGSQSD